MPYAAITNVSIVGNVDDAQKQLEQVVVPRSKSAKGFVSGIWSRNTTTKKGVGVVVFETEQDANDFVSMVQSTPPPDDTAVRIDSTEVYEVGAQA